MRVIAQMAETHNEAKDFYYNLIENLQIALVVVNDDLEIEYANKVFIEKIAGGVIKVKGRHCYEILHQREKRCRNCYARKATQRKRIVRVNFARDDRLYEVTAIPIDSEDNKEKWAVLVYIDVTEMKELESQLLQASKMADLGQLAAGVAHELRNPLGIINTSLYYLKDVLDQGAPDVQKHLRIIGEEVIRSRKIIDNLLEFSRKSVEEVEDVDVNELLRTILAILEKDFLTNDIRLELHFGLLPRTRLNLDALKQAFLNIILNSVQAMTNGGRLTITTRLLAAAPLAQSTGSKEINGDYLQVVFEDSGPGIPSKILKNIFDPFVTTKEPGQGTGLGLTITYAIIKRSGGDIKVESKMGKGTKVTVYLPARRA